MTARDLFVTMVVGYFHNYADKTDCPREDLAMFIGNVLELTMDDSDQILANWQRLEGPQTPETLAQVAAQYLEETNYFEVSE